MIASQDRLYLEISPDNTYGFRKCCDVIREAVSIEEVTRCYTDLETMGGRAWFTGCCPLPDHEDNEPSFYIYPPGRWWCYGCNRGGDVVDLEFHCGDYAELWEAMISLASEFDVELPSRQASWSRRQERQRPMRYGIEAAKVYVARRRLYMKFFEPLILATEDQDARAHDAQLFWELTAPIAEHLVANMMGSRSDG
jgi:DNA primase